MLRSIREVMVMMPELQRFRERLESDDFPTPEELTQARTILAAAKVTRVDLFTVSP